MRQKEQEIEDEWTPGDLEELEQIKQRAKKEFSRGNRDHKYYGSVD